MKIVKTYIFSHEAHLDLAKLKDEGIDAIIFDDNFVHIYPILSNAIGGIKLKVNDEDYDKATAILKRNDYNNLIKEFPDSETEEQNKCPNCGSIRVIQKQSWLAGLLFLIYAAIPFSIRKNSFFCMDCSHHWKGKK